LAGLTINDKTLLRQMSSVPTLAWPTLGVFVGGFALWAGGMGAHMAGVLPSWLAVVTGFVAIYLLYMAMHEAAHGSLARDRRLNDIVGSIASIPFLGAFPLYRHAHRRHHSHTNSKDDDPDFWSGGKPLLARWLTQDFHYVQVYRNSSRHFTLAQKFQNAVQPVAFLVFMAGLAYGGYWESVLFAWFVPWRLAIGWLAFAFNYLPHAPYKVEQSKNRFAATVCRQPRWLKWILLFQNYHIIHHLYPMAPFYRIEKMWDIGRDYFREHGTRVV
jgi:fatty acid desaturase